MPPERPAASDEQPVAGMRQHELRAVVGAGVVVEERRSTPGQRVGVVA